MFVKFLLKCNKRCFADTYFLESFKEFKKSVLYRRTEEVLPDHTVKSER